MKSKYHLVLVLAAGLLAACQPREESLQELADRVFGLARTQLALLDTELQEGPCPRSFQDGVLITSDIGWWCSGFYPGSLWLTWEHTGDASMKQLALKHTEPL